MSESSRKYITGEWNLAFSYEFRLRVCEKILGLSCAGGFFRKLSVFLGGTLSPPAPPENFLKEKGRHWTDTSTEAIRRLEQGGKAIQIEG